MRCRPNYNEANIRGDENTWWSAKYNELYFLSLILSASRRDETLDNDLCIKICHNTLHQDLEKKSWANGVSHCVILDEKDENIVARTWTP